MKHYSFVSSRVCWPVLVLGLILIALACEAQPPPWPQTPAKQAEHPVSSPSPSATPLPYTPMEETERSVSSPSPSPSASPLPQSPIEEAESRWQQQGIASYRIEVSVFRSIHHAQFYQITVQDGAVVNQSASCTPAPLESGKCKVEPFEAEAYTVPGLFTKARSLLEGDYKTWGNVSFDSTYGFPSQISYDRPDAMDEDWGWRVASFEVLP